MDTHYYSFSYADKVFSIDHLLSEILSRVPVRSLFRLKSISKHWNSLISSPTFKCHIYPHPHPPSGLYISVPTRDYLFVPFDPADTNPIKARFITLDHIDSSAKNSTRIEIKQSCNGLLLCSSEYVCEKRLCVITDNHYVYNPTINEITRFDGPDIYVDDGLRHLATNIAFDPSKSPHYRIIYLYSHHRLSYCQINMYSSQTRTCKLSLKFVVSSYSDIEYNSGVYWNNAIHWIDIIGGCISYFNLDREMIYDKLTPSFPPGSIFKVLKDCKNYIFESRDHFLLVEISCPLISKFKIYELKRDYSEWFVKFHVDLEQFGERFREIFNARKHASVTPEEEFDVLALVLGEKDDDSFLVVEISRQIIRLNLELKTYNKLHDITIPSLDPLYQKSLQWPYVYQFMSLSTAFDG